MRTRSASADEIYLGALYHYDHGLLPSWRWHAVRVVYLAALRAMRWAA